MSHCNLSQSILLLSLLVMILLLFLLLDNIYMEVIVVPTYVIIECRQI